jgi:hypothetical protein
MLHVSRVQLHENVVEVQVQPHLAGPDATPMEEHVQFWPAVRLSMGTGCGLGLQYSLLHLQPHFGSPEISPVSEQWHLLVQLVRGQVQPHPVVPEAPPASVQLQSAALHVVSAQLQLHAGGPEGVPSGVQLHVLQPASVVPLFAAV